MSGPSEHHRPADASAPDDVAGAAALWAVRRERGLTEAEALALAAWQASDPRHAAELERIGAVSQRLDQLGAVPRLAAEADAVATRGFRRNHRRKLLRFGAVWAAAAAAVTVAWLAWSPRRPDATSPAAQLPAPRYHVLTSTAREESLPDGSVVELNGDSRIETDFTPTERHLRLVRGEAHFRVAHDPSRPFLVSAEALTVRAVGTIFNVRLAADTIDVLVTEGKVRLEGTRPDGTKAREISGSAAPALVAGQKAVVPRPATAMPAAPVIATPSPGEIDDELAWRTTRLVFDDTPLDEVVAAFNRYNRHQLELDDPTLRRRTLSGVFRADNLDGFLRLLEASVDVTPVRRSADHTALLPAR